MRKLRLHENGVRLTVSCAAKTRARNCRETAQAEIFFRFQAEIFFRFYEEQLTASRLPQSGGDSA